MAVDIVSVLHTGVFLAVVLGLYGWLVGVVWTPFLVSKRLRQLFDALPPREWLVNYVLWIPLPAVVWGFLFGAGLSLSRDVLSPGTASPLYAAGVDGIVLATVVSLVLWPVLLLYILPEKGIDWVPEGDQPNAALLVVAGVVWYLVFLVGPAYVFTLFAGFGDSFSGT
ncbi:MAG: hypothetical protein V5A38_13240 [Halolamina sp.]|uniref:hypothetical protein n=1 Tax=Halolamina sp. TaxID=1940283 RepID=UPI002FC31750